MKNALILHGTQGGSNDNWHPWLKKELENKGYKVWLPDLPGAEHPDLKRYLRFIFSNKEWEFNSESVIIGHSSGAVATLAILNELQDKISINTCILVSVFEKNSPGGKWSPNKDLFNYKFDLQHIKNKVRDLVFIISDNDPYCTVEYVKKLGSSLGGKVIVTHGDGHFSVASGGEKYKKFPLIKKFL